MEKRLYKEEVIPLTFKIALSFFKDSQDEPEDVYKKNEKIILDLLKDKRSSETISENEDCDFDWSEIGLITQSKLTGGDEIHRIMDINWQNNRQTWLDGQIRQSNAGVEGR